MKSTTTSKIKLVRPEQAAPPAQSSTDWSDRTREPSRFESGSIEQHLDMCESGPYRGDEILHHHGLDSSTDGPYSNYRGIESSVDEPKDDSPSEEAAQD